MTKINATNTGPFGNTQGNVTIYPGTHLKIISLFFSVSAMVLRIQWHGTPNVDIVNLSQADNWQMIDVSHRGFSGIPCPGGSGQTGSIDFTTVGAAANSAYTVIMTLLKGI